MEKRKPGVDFLSFTAEIFDAVFVAYLAALSARSIDTTEISRQVTAVTNAPEKEYNFTELDQAMAALCVAKKYICWSIWSFELFCWWARWNCDLRR